MNVEIISIGDELLIGQTVNTNASWIGKELSNLGARIEKPSQSQIKRKKFLKVYQILKTPLIASLLLEGLDQQKMILQNTPCVSFLILH